MIDNNIINDINNLSVYDSFLKTNSKLQGYSNVLVSVSGGSDSDIIVDLISKCQNKNSKYNYVFFDTGLEYIATKEHLKFLEEKYKIKIL